MKAAKAKTPKTELGISVGRALRRAARSARKTAKMHGTPIYVFEKGRVVAVKP